MFIKPFGTFTLISILSTSSYIWSLFGHQILAPIPWQLVAAKCFPFESLVQDNPPSQGALTASFGLPS